jgi:hypothetical protein
MGTISRSIATPTATIRRAYKKKGIETAEGKIGSGEQEAQQEGNGKRGKWSFASSSGFRSESAVESGAECDAASVAECDDDGASDCSDDAPAAANDKRAKPIKE